MVVQGVGLSEPMYLLDELVSLWTGSRHEFCHLEALGEFACAVGKLHDKPARCSGGLYEGLVRPPRAGTRRVVVAVFHPNPVQRPVTVLRAVPTLAIAHAQLQPPPLRKLLLG